jgi:hypothetical protein
MTRTALTSAASSTYTSNPVLVADYRELNVSLSSTGTGAHTWQASNVDGFRSALTDNDFSTITSVTVKGSYSLDAGMRWLRFIKPATDSLSTVIITGRT